MMPAVMPGGGRRVPPRVLEPPSAGRVAAAIGWGTLLLLAYLVYVIASPFLLALGWAAVFAIVLHPLHAAMSRRVGRSWAAAAGTLVLAATLAAPAVLVLPVFVREALDTAARIQQVAADGRLAPLQHVWEEVARRVPAAGRVDPGDVLAGAARAVAGHVGLLLRSMAAFVFDLVVALFATFFLLRDAPAVMGTVRRLLPMPEPAREQLIRRTGELVSVGVTSAVLVAGVQGIVGGLVFWALAIPSPVFWGGVMALLCLLPFGAWVVWAPASAVLAIDGELTRAIVLAAAGFAVISATDNVLRPMLVSGRTHMNGLVIFVGLLGGASAFGLLGIVIGPILVATALGLLTPYVEAPRRVLTAGGRGAGRRRPDSGRV